MDEAPASDVIQVERRRMIGRAILFVVTPVMTAIEFAWYLGVGGPDPVLDAVAAAVAVVAGVLAIALARQIYVRDQALRAGLVLTPIIGACAIAVWMLLRRNAANLPHTAIWLVAWSLLAIALPLAMPTKRGSGGTRTALRSDRLFRR